MEDRTRQAKNLHNFEQNGCLLHGVKGVRLWKRTAVTIGLQDECIAESKPRQAPEASSSMQWLLQCIAQPLASRSAEAGVSLPVLLPCVSVLRGIHNVMRPLYFWNTR
jgi:pyrroloquinoline quinone (PQQ) biosynthesis protein C